MPRSRTRTTKDPAHQPPAVAHDDEGVPYEPPYYCLCRFKLALVVDLLVCNACGAVYRLEEGKWHRVPREEADAILPKAAAPAPRQSAPAPATMLSRVLRLVRLLLPGDLGEPLAQLARRWDDRWSRRCDNCQRYDYDAGQDTLRHDQGASLLAGSQYLVDGRPYVMKPEATGGCFLVGREALVRGDSVGCKAHVWRWSEITRRLRTGGRYRSEHDGTAAAARGGRRSAGDTPGDVHQGPPGGAAHLRADGR